MDIDATLSVERLRLARLLAGHGRDTTLDDVDAEVWLSMGYREGVTALLAARLDSGSDTSPDVRDAFAARAHALAASELLQRAALIKVLAALTEARIPALVLKGSALRQWLYPAPYLRESSDIDLLFANREQAIAAAEMLKPMGYGVQYIPGCFAHEMLCRRSGGGIDLDLHWALTAIPALDGLPGFDALRASAIALPGLGPSAMGLSPIHALLHACVHRASNLGAGLGDRLKWLYDIHLLATRFAEGEWDGFVAACRDARLCGIAMSGLRATQALFATRVPIAVMEQLGHDAATDALDATRLADWRYVQRRNLASLDGIATRATWLWSRAFPPAGYMRELYGSEHGWFGLMWQRSLRLLARFTSRPGSANG